MRQDRPKHEGAPPPAEDGVGSLLAVEVVGGSRDPAAL